MSKLLPVLAIAALALAPAAFAQTNQRPSQPPATAPAPAPAQPNGRTLSEAQLKQELERIGFTKVSNIKQQGNTIQARATNREGKRVSINIDTNTGKVTAK